MARSRRTPPLFEVMRETDPKLAGGVAPTIRSTESTSTAERGTPTVRVFPRISSAERGGESRAGGAEAGAADSGDASRVRRAGILVSYTGLWLCVGGAALVLAFVAYFAYRSGAEDEKNRILASRTQTPPGEVSPSPVSSEPNRDRSASPSAVESTPSLAPPSNTGKQPALPVLGEDPRQVGWNYLTVATLFRNDAASAAQFLTDSGIPCVVVAPEGKSPEALLQDRRANWIVIAREGIAPDQYKTTAAQSRRSELVREVKRLGIRWKQDHKGSSDFADPYWNKFGK